MGKRLVDIKKECDKSKLYSIDEAVSFFATHARKTFDETVELVLKLGIDTKKSDQVVRGVTVLPHGLGKKIIVAYIVDQNRVSEAVNAGADIVGSEDLIDKIDGGFLDFDVCLAVPSMMPKLVKIAKKLGMRGLMPSPKNGTVSDEIANVVKNIKMGQVTFKADKGGVIHVGVGKISFDKTKIIDNIMVVYNAVLASKPEKSKGEYMLGAFISTTQCISLKLDTKSLVR